jgi:hypothetical protein
MARRIAIWIGIALVTVGLTLLVLGFWFYGILITLIGAPTALIAIFAKPVRRHNASNGLLPRVDPASEWRRKASGGRKETAFRCGLSQVGQAQSRGRQRSGRIRQYRSAAWSNVTSSSISALGVTYSRRATPRTWPRKCSRTSGGNVRKARPPVAAADARTAGSRSSPAG